MSTWSVAGSHSPVGRVEGTRTVTDPIPGEAFAAIAQESYELPGDVADLSEASPVRDDPCRGNAAGEAIEPGRHHQQTWVVMASDVASTAVALTTGLLITAVITRAPQDSLGHLGDSLLPAISFPVIAIPMIGIYGLYRRRLRRLRHSSFGDLAHLMHAIAMTALATLGISSLFHRFAGLQTIAPTSLIGVSICAMVAIPAGRRISWWLHVRMLTKTGVNKQGANRVLVVGSGMIAQRISSYLSDDPTIDVVGYVDDNPAPGSPTLGRIADAPRICTDLRIDRVLIGFSRTHPLAIIEQLRPLQNSVAISIVPRYFELLSWRSEMDEICGLPFIDVAPAQLSLTARLIKRSFDVVGAIAGLIVLAPLLVAIVVMIKLSSPGPLLFRQQRIGLGERPFAIYKFRTMSINAENERESLSTLNDIDGPTFKMRVDPRAYAFGRFLRRLSLDEIPQLLNILRGDMSLVGPRPFILSESEHIDGWAARRFDVRPGLSGLWQISGRNDLSFDELRRLDYVYVASWSLWWDLRILWHTPGSVLKSRGAY